MKALLIVFLLPLSVFAAATDTQVVNLSAKCYTGSKVNLDGSVSCETPYLTATLVNGKFTTDYIALISGSGTDEEQARSATGLCIALGFQNAQDFRRASIKDTYDNYSSIDSLATFNGIGTLASLQSRDYTGAQITIIRNVVCR